MRSRLTASPLPARAPIVIVIVAPAARTVHEGWQWQRDQGVAFRMDRPSPVHESTSFDLLPACRFPSEAPRAVWASDIVALELVGRRPAALLDLCEQVGLLGRRDEARNEVGFWEGRVESVDVIHGGRMVKEQSAAVQAHGHSFIPCPCTSFSRNDISPSKAALHCIRSRLLHTCITTIATASLPIAPQYQSASSRGCGHYPARCPCPAAVGPPPPPRLHSHLLQQLHNRNNGIQVSSNEWSDGSIHVQCTRQAQTQECCSRPA